MRIANALTPDLNELRAFCVAADLGTLGRAAVRLHVSQPSLSKRVAALEAKVGARLFERSPRGVSLTPAGRRLYRDARALVLPSLDEGFGLPALEGLACGVPVVASAAGSLPEVVGDAGILVNPRDPDAWASALASLLNDQRAQAWAVRGPARAAAFSWDATATATRRAYDAAVAARRERG